MDINYGFIRRSSERKQTGFMALTNIPNNSAVFADTDKFCSVSGRGYFRHGFMVGNAKEGDELVMFHARTNFFYVLDKDGVPIDDNGNKLNEYGHRVETED